MGKRSKPNKGKKKKKRGPSIADRADRHTMYQRAVQHPEGDIAIFTDIYQRLRARTPLRLREDFCGTANLSVRWALSDPRRSAVGVDIHAPTLTWGREHNVEPNADELEGRVELIEGDVLDALQPSHGERADISCAMNFSFCVFRERATLRRYFEAAYRGLADDGLLIVELYGGHEAKQEVVDRREVDGGVYVWEQEFYNPIDHHTLCHIHFEFSDGSKMLRAFTYDWRLWTIPEIRELLEEVGFSSTRVFWETVEEDEDDDEMLTGSGIYEEMEEVENQESWLVYIVGERQT
jgi:SAM-dependent methyltransferase